jgi:hypothetical protein
MLLTWHNKKPITEIGFLFLLLGYLTVRWSAEADLEPAIPICQQ